MEVSSDTEEKETKLEFEVSDDDSIEVDVPDESGSDDAESKKELEESFAFGDGAADDETPPASAEDKTPAPESKDGDDASPDLDDADATPPPTEALADIDPMMAAAAQEVGFSDEYTEKLQAAGLLEETLSTAVMKQMGYLAGETEISAQGEAPSFEGLDPDLHDEETVQRFKDQAIENASLKERLQSVQVAQQEREFKRCIADLGEEWEPIFGKGNVQPDSSGSVNRTRLLREMREVGFGMQGAGTLNGVTLSTIFNKGLKMGFSEHQQKLATEKLATKVKARAKQILPRPKNTASKPVTGDAAAIDAVRQIAKDRKLDIGNDDGFD